ncbi:hypothetical protein DFJ68_0382 [Terracoccus luteus]|uniref:Secreted protein n=1 Tax=Terracoccus luteus TaxID=53356 RepID=A0A495XV51_9MICO|nr:SIMPL domain-containing protein [Terracoccus luteus]RKT76975.1 hypothetical protein DFJ68_0382 [Terracoccus luteus]
MSRRTVTVSGTGWASAVPDVVRVSLQVGHDSSDVATALDGAAESTAAVISALRSAGVDASDVRTETVSVNQRWDNQGNGPIGFTASQRLGVTVREVDGAGRVLTAAATAAGNALLVDSLTLEVSDPEPALREARDGAFADARSKAEQYAGLARVRLGDVVEIGEGGAMHSPVPVTARRAKADAAMTVPMPVEGASQGFTASVTVTWRLVDAD